MTLRIYNTLSRGLEPFVSLEPGHVRMYVCGMTVYDLCHLGHARAMVAFDVVQRWLKAGGWRVTYVRNITDIDDKIIQRALKNGETIRSLTDRMIVALHQDADALGIERPTHEPRAMDYVPQMLNLIGQLESQGLAYPSPNGDVNYAVRKFPGYGKLSGKSLDELRAGERVAVADAKQDPLDFVLWKSAKADEPAEAKWDGPYGPGRPGWHIECSAMSCDLLGDSFDIHGGGADLQFPHHENEIAQSEGAQIGTPQQGQPMARYWMHNGFVRVDNEKMSKSLGNFFTIREVLEKYDAQTVRFFILRAHYRSPLNYSDAHLDDARSALKRLYTALQKVSPMRVEVLWPRRGGVSASGAIHEYRDEGVGGLTIYFFDPADGNVGGYGDYAARFKAAMDEDFGTPEAVAVLFDLASEVNKTGSTRLAGLLKTLGACLGLLQEDPSTFLQSGASAALEVSAIESLIAQRAAAKAAKNYAEADRIRQELLAQGIVLKDAPTGTIWEVAA